jgi:hypothetical protein
MIDFLIRDIYKIMVSKRWIEGQIAVGIVAVQFVRKYRREWE